MTTVLISGASGFLGSRLVRSGLAAGSKVGILIRRSSERKRISGIESQLEVFFEDQMDLAFKALRPVNAVLHTATIYGRNGESPEEVFRTNLTFSRRLLSVATENKVESFMNADTLPSNLDSPYARSKREFTRFAEGFAQNKLRYFNMVIEHMYGGGDDASKFTGFVVQSLLNRTPSIDLTAGEQSRDFIYVDDVVSAFETVLSHAQDFAEGFHSLGVGTSHPVSIRKFVTLAKSLSNSNTELRFGILPYRSGEIMESRSDTSALRNLGWRPQYDLESGLRATLEQQRRES